MDLEEDKTQVQNADTVTATEEVKGTEQETPKTETEEEAKLTQSQVNDIVTKRLAKQSESFYKRYGVSDENQLDELFKKAKDYDELSKKMSELSETNSKLNERVLFDSNSIGKDREDDVRTYFKGKGLDLSEEALKEAIKTHPEWCEAPKTTTLIPMGSSGVKGDELTDEEKAMKLFGLSFK